MAKALFVVGAVIIALSIAQLTHNTTYLVSAITISAVTLIILAFSRPLGSYWLVVLASKSGEERSILVISDTNYFPAAKVIIFNKEKNGSSSAPLSTCWKEKISTKDYRFLKKSESLTVIQ